MKIEIRITNDGSAFVYYLGRFYFVQQWYDVYPIFSLKDTLIDSTDLKDYKTIRLLSKINIIKTEIRKLNK